MLDNTSKEFRTFFLLKFTEELIKNHSDIEIIRLEELLIKKGKIIETKKIDIKKEVQEKLNEMFSVPRENLKIDPFSKQNKFKKKIDQRKLSIPVKRNIGFETQKSSLPSTVSHIRPIASKKVLIDLGKITPLINDEDVKIIEVEGENQKVIVDGQMGRKPTSVSLTSEEINQIIDIFSKEAKIPKIDGIFKVALGNLVLTAVIFQSVSSRFIIKKLEEVNPPIRPSFK